MRKFIFSMLLFGMIFGIVGCAGGANSNDDVKNPQNNQKSKMPVIKITANYLATSEEDGYVEKTVNDFVKLPVAKSVKEQTKGQDWAAGYANAPDPFYKASTITVINEDGTVVLNEAAGKVKVRGNWTTTYKKKPLRIKFDEKQSMLGLNDGNEFKNWVLLASYKDRSFLRDITGFTLGKELSPDYYASDFKLVEVYVNDEYFGVYILVEQQEVKKERINIDDAEDTSLTETGYLIEYDRYYEFEDEETVFELKHGSEVKDRNGEIVSEFNIESNKGYAGYTIKNDLSETNYAAQRDYIKNYMQTLWNECYAAVNDSTKSEAAIKAVIEQYIDVQSLVDTYLLQEIVCDPDLYITSFFMTLDMSATGNRKLTFQAPWDFDSTMGNKEHDANDQGLYAGVVGYDVNHGRRGTGNPWMMLLVNQPWFNEMVKEKWNAVKGSVFSKVTNQITSLTSEYSANFEANYKTWPMESNDEYRPAAAACKTQSEAATQLKNWLNTRKSSLDDGINSFEPKDFTKDKNDYFYAEATENGILVKFFLPEGISLPDRYSANIAESTTGMEMSLSSGDLISENNMTFTKDNPIEILFPFVEKDKQYTFNFSGKISSQNDWFVSPSVTVKATKTVKPFDFSDFNTSKTTCEIITEGDVSYFVIENDKAESTKASIKTKCGYDTKDIYSGLWGYAKYDPGTWAWGVQKQAINHDILMRKGNYNTYAVGYNIEVVVGDGKHPYGWKSPCVWSENYKYPESAPQPWDVWYNGQVFNDFYSYPLEYLLSIAQKYGLEENTDYILDVANKRIILTENGNDKINERS